MSVMAGGLSGGEEEREIPFSQSDINLLLRTLANIYNTEARAMTFLRSVQFPRELVPVWNDGGTPIGFWSLIFEDLERGVMTVPYRRLFTAAAAVYASNPALADLQRRYPEERQPAIGQQQAGAGEGSAARQQPEPAPTCHLIAWLESEEARADLEAWLAEQGLDPQPEWITPTSLSYRVNETDPRAVDRLMSRRRDINWTVVAPGIPDYVLRYLSVQGPDGQSFRFSDVPSATPVSSVASELVDQYTGGVPGGGDQPTVVEHVGADGPRRMNPDSTLAEEGITEGSRLRVGFERRAAAVNPLDRREALFRVRNQLRAYRNTHPGFNYKPNSPALPTEYDIEFSQPSFGPPKTVGEQPPDISVHQLSIILLPDFPIVAPQVRWLTEVFHPNVWPTYESEKLREYPYARGAVCLGTLAESYQPSLDFGELCATLEDIAGYRNYSVYVLADDELTGQPTLRGDFYDKEAAMWAITAQGQQRILQIGGTPLLRVASDRRGRLGFEIELDEIFRSDDYVPDGEIPLVPVLLGVFADVIGEERAGVRFELTFYRLMDDTPDLGKPAVENLRASHGFVRVRIMRGGKLLYQHPHPVQEVIGEPLRELLRSRDREVTHWGYGVRGPGLEGIALSRPAPQVRHEMRVRTGTRRRAPLYVEPMPEPEPPLATLATLGVYADLAAPSAYHADPSGALEPGEFNVPEGQKSLDGPDLDPPVVIVIPSELVTRLVVTYPFSDEIEEGGFLAGAVYRDAERPGCFLVHVTEVMPAERTGASIINFTFTGESFLRVSHQLENLGGDEKLLGWYHTHLFAATARSGLSSVDVELHRSTFRRPWQVAALVNITDDGRVLRFYYGEGNEMTLVPYWTVPSSASGATPITEDSPVAESPPAAEPSSAAESS